MVRYRVKGGGWSGTGGRVVKYRVKGGGWSGIGQFGQIGAS